MSKRDSEQTTSPAEARPSGTAAGISRRSFGRRAAQVAALSLSPIPLLAAPPAPSQTSGAPEQLSGKQNSGLAPELAQEVEAKLANIVRKYGMRLSDAQRQHLRRILTYNEKMLASVHAFSLQNGDPPASVLTLVAGDERAALAREGKV